MSGSSIPYNTPCYCLKAVNMNQNNFGFMNSTLTNITQNNDTTLTIYGFMLFSQMKPPWFFVYCCLAMVFGVILNILTIFVLKMGRRIGKDIKFQLVNLVVADLLTACCLPTWYIVDILMTDTEHVALESPGYRMCQVIIWVVLGVTGASPLFNMLISLERFIVICFPLRARFYTKTLKRIAVAMTWITAFAGEAYLFTLDASDSEYTTEGTSLVEMCRVRVRTASVLVWILIQISIPTLTIIFCYICVVIKLCRRQKLGVSGCQTNEKFQSKQTREVCMIAQTDYIQDVLDTPQSASKIEVLAFNSEKKQAFADPHLR